MTSPFDSTILSNDLDNIIADLPTTINIAGTDYQGTKGQLSAERLYNDFGFGDEYDFTFYINFADLSSEPERHSKVIINNTTHRILTTEKDSANSLFRIHLGNEFGKFDSN